MSFRASKHTLVPGYLTKVSFKRHIIPPVIGLLTIAAVLAALNWQIIASKLHYQIKVNAATNASDTKLNVQKSDSKPLENRIVINSIDVNAPLVFSSSTNEGVFQKALQSGVTHYPASVLPGTNGNIALFGHSSGLPWTPGKYKFVFTLLDKLQPGDSVSLDYAGKTYLYRVSSKEVVSPSSLESIKTKDPTSQTLTLVTCTPVGTSTNRLVVHAYRTN